MWSVAVVAQRRRRLNRVQAEDHTTVLRLLTERRDDLIAERTRTMNRLPPRHPATQRRVYVVAVSQARDLGPGQQLYRRKLAEAKTPNEARRSLKRRLSNIIYRRLGADQKTARRSGT